jgi:hypothetical protein
MIKNYKNSGHVSFFIIIVVVVFEKKILSLSEKNHKVHLKELKTIKSLVKRV